MLFYIFRHGETYYTKNNLHYGEHFADAEILPEAVPVTEKIGNYLNGKLSDNNYTSPFKRALQTVAIISKITGKNFTRDERIREEGLSRAEETLEALEKRLKNFISEVENKNIENCAVCSHGWPIATLTALLTKGSTTKSDLGKFPKCGQLLIIENRSVKTLDFN